MGMKTRQRDTRPDRWGVSMEVYERHNRHKFMTYPELKARDELRRQRRQFAEARRQAKLIAEAQARNEAA